MKQKLENLNLDLHAAIVKTTLDLQHLTDELDSGRQVHDRPMNIKALRSLNALFDVLHAVL